MSQQNGQLPTTSESMRRGRLDQPDVADPQRQASAIEKSVTHLLVATKQLLETLTAWSRGTATENDVSDVYVRLGYEFNIACRAFTSVGIDTSDLGPVPDTLRSILEQTLSQEASQTSLDNYLPRIRDIIINLLHGLKKKQQKLRQKTRRDDGSAPLVGRQDSLASTLSSRSDESENPRRRRDSPMARSDANDTSNGLPPRTSSSGKHASALGSATKRLTASSHNEQHFDQSRSDGSVISNAMHGIPVIPPTPDQSSVKPAPEPQQIPRPQAQDHLSPNPPHKQQDALAALQRGGDLERRASRRFSQYQISRHLGTSAPGMPMMPPTQRSPIPNRGRDIRESMNAVRNRGGSHRSRSNLRTGNSPSRNGFPASPIREEMRDKQNRGSGTSISPPIQRPADDSPYAKTPEENYPSLPRSGERESMTSATVTQPWSEHYPTLVSPSEVTEPDETAGRQEKLKKETDRIESQNQAGDTETNSQEPLTLFLQYKTKVKKCVLNGGFAELSIARIQLAFIERFNWSTQNNGTDLPEIYVQDQVSGIRHELEDLNDVKNNSVLVLNVDEMDEMKRHFDESFGGLRGLVDGVRIAINDQQGAIQRVSERQQDAAKDLARFATASPQTMPEPTRSANTSAIISSKGSASQLSEVQSLRRELAVMRQVYTSHVSNMESEMSNLRTKAEAVKSSAIKTSIHSVDGDSGRAYVDAGKKILTEDSERIINRVDDLQDTVEDLRKDVVSRGVRPLPRQLESVTRELASATADLRKLREYLGREKPIWTKVQEELLNSVCDDQNVLKMQEDLAADLEDDLEKAAETFALVEQATKQQHLQNGPGNTSRTPSKTLNHVGGDVDPHKARDVVMGEVKALQPNHESRLEAIERAEKARQLELVNRGLFGNAFKQELGSFVDEGRLRKTGGIEETERLRISREEKARRENWERQAARAAGIDVEQEAFANPSPSEAAGADEPVQLEVPSQDDGGTTSPEPEFVEAEEGPPVHDGS